MCTIGVPPRENEERKLRRKKLEGREDPRGHPHHSFLGKGTAKRGDSRVVGGLMLKHNGWAKERGVGTQKAGQWYKKEALMKKGGTGLPHQEKKK